MVNRSPPVCGGPDSLARGSGALWVVWLEGFLTIRLTHGVSLGPWLPAWVGGPQGRMVENEPPSFRSLNVLVTGNLKI